MDLMNINIINLTPHEVNVRFLGSEELCSFPPSGQVARCQASTQTVGTINGLFGLTRTVYGEVTDLPASGAGKMYIVSSLVALACPERTDLLIPNESLRDEAGKIYGCKSFGTVANA